MAAKWRAMSPVKRLALRLGAGLAFTGLLFLLGAFVWRPFGWLILVVMVAVLPTPGDYTMELVDRWREWRGRRAARKL